MTFFPKNTFQSHNRANSLLLRKGETFFRLGNELALGFNWLHSKGGEQ